jgi:hypothetical protein
LVAIPLSSKILRFTRYSLGQVFVLVVSAMLSFFSCKPEQQLVADKKDPITDTTERKADSIFFDAAVPLEEVKIKVHRLHKDTISVIGVGDIMMGTNFPGPEYLPKRNGEYLWEEVVPILNSADFTFGNLEGVLLDSGGIAKECKNPDVCYLFRSPLRLAKNFKMAGFDMLSLANNHAGDFGDVGRISTMHILDSLNIQHAGQVLQPFTVFKSQHLTIGFAAFSPNYGTLSINDIDSAERIISHLDSLCDFTIVSFHGGAEGKDHQHVTRENETYYGENRGNVYEFSHRLIDVGADLIFGHGPHVTRAIELYRSRLICYSLGNFLTYARFNLRGPNGIAPIVKAYIKPDGTFLYGEIIPTFQDGVSGVKIDSTGRVIKKLQELNLKDFPENKLVIHDNGQMNTLETE